MYHPLGGRCALRPVLLAGGLCLAAAPAPAERLPEGFPLRKGVFAFCHASDLGAGVSAEELSWLARFRVLLVNGHEVPAPEVQRTLRARGCRVLRYFWVNGFPRPELEYAMPDGRWRADVLREHPDWLLSAEPLPGPPGTPESHYYDLAQRELVGFLAPELRDFRRANGYGGVFLDYAGEYALPAEARRAWTQRNPSVPYDRALAGFLRRLRATDRDGLIATNQACRSAERLLPLVDYDLVESYGTSYAWGPVAQVAGRDVAETYVRPWTGPGGLAEMLGSLQATLSAARPQRALLCLDYMRPWTVQTPQGLQESTDLEAVYYSYCAAALYGLPSFCSGWYGREYRGNLYFADLGRPLGAQPVEHDGLVTREYERGLIALLPGTAETKVAWRSAGGTPIAGLWDLLAGRRLPAPGGEAVLRLAPVRSPVSGALRPSARVYLKG